MRQLRLQPGMAYGAITMKVTALRRYASAATLLALMGSATAFAQQGDRPNAEHHAISQRWLTDIRVAMP
jgi:hypothetical protein